MKSIAKRLPPGLIHLLLGALLPVGALAGQASSSMEVTVQVVRGESTAVAALMESAATRNSTNPAIDSDAQCKTIGNTVVVDGVWATCSWDPGSHMYWVTVRY